METPRWLEDCQRHTYPQRWQQVTSHKLSSDKLDEPAICRTFESIIRDSIVAHLESNETINETQPGFSKGGWCLSNLLRFLDQVMRNIEEDECVDIIYLDLAKVPHWRLMEKLDKDGIKSRVRHWIKEWLRDRSQRVCVNGCSVDRRPMTSVYASRLSLYRSDPIFDILLMISNVV